MRTVVLISRSLYERGAESDEDARLRVMAAIMISIEMAREPERLRDVQMWGFRVWWSRN